jgi:hypothetical protein
MSYRLPLTLPITVGESVLSMLNRTAHLLDCSLDEILRITEAASGDKRQRIEHVESEALSDAETTNIATALAIPRHAVAAGTVAVYQDRALRLTTPKRRVAHFTLWSEPDRGAVCPDCIREGRGRQISWRIAWTVVCDRHDRLLLDTCPYCQNRIPINSPAHTLNPNACGADADGSACTFDLSLTSGEHVNPSHSLARSAAFIRRLIAKEPHDDVVRDELNDYRAAAVGLLRACEPEELQQRAHLTETSLSGLWHKPLRVGAAPPADTLFTGALLTAAHEILRHPDGQHRIALIRPLLQDQSARSPDRTPSAQLRSYGPFSQRFERLALHALDRDLGVIDRLRYRSPTNEPQRPNDRTQRDAENIARRTPQLFWPEQAFILADHASGDADTFRAALSTAYAMIGRTDRTVAVVHEELGWQEPHAPQFRGHLLGDDTRTEATIRWLCELRGDISVNADLQAVNYAKRRRYDLSRLLPDSTWEPLTARLHWRSDGIRKRHCTRWYLARLLTGQSRPNGITAPSAAEYTAFLLTLQPPEVVVLNSVAQHLVTATGVAEPTLARPQPQAGQRMSVLASSRWDRCRVALTDALTDRARHSLVDLRRHIGVSAVQLRLLLEFRIDDTDSALTRDEWALGRFPNLARAPRSRRQAVAQSFEPVGVTEL